MKTSIGLVLLTMAVSTAASGCSSPPPAGTPPPAALAAAPPASPGGAPPTPAVERDGLAPPTTAGPTPAAPAAAAPAAPPVEVLPPPTYTIATGRSIAVFTTTTLSTKTAQSGERFVATLAEPIVDGDWVVAKKGARVGGVVVDSDPGNRVKGVASISVTVDSLTLADGRTVALSSSRYRRQARATKAKDATKIGIATGVGAAIGAIAGGGKGAAIGAGVGGGAGTGVVLATRGDPAVIAAETRVRFTLKSPVTITKVN